MLISVIFLFYKILDAFPMKKIWKTGLDCCVRIEVKAKFRFSVLFDSIRIIP